MTQDDKWQARYAEVKAFIEKNHRNPSKHDEEERGKYLNPPERESKVLCRRCGQYWNCFHSSVGFRPFDVSHQGCYLHCVLPGIWS